jgi:cytochrome b6-f complex iron-sulfur subunit
MINRRQFVALATSAGCAAAAICGCSSSGGGDAPPWTGPTSFDLGAPADLKEGVDPKWMQSGGFFVVREGGRLFAVSAICSHKACPLSPKPTEYLCPCHGSRFTRAGKVVNGPAFTSLPRFGVALNPSGHVTVDRTKVFPEAQWGQPGASLTL